MDGGAPSFAGALVGDAMGDLYSPSAVAFGGVQGESFTVAFETSVVDGGQHGAVTGSQFVDMTDLESRPLLPFMPVAGLVATEAVQEWRSGVINTSTPGIRRRCQFGKEGICSSHLFRWGRSG